jgi:hypothetical protein
MWPKISATQPYLQELQLPPAITASHISWRLTRLEEGWELAAK